MKLSVYTLVGVNDSLKDVVKISKKVGYDAVDIRMCDDGIHILPDIKDEKVKEIKKFCEDIEIEISGLTSYYLLGVSDKKERKEMMDKIKRSIEITNLLGARYLRVSSADIDFNIGYEAQREIFREDCSYISKIGKNWNVIVTVEQHSLALTASAGQIVDLMRGIENPYIGIVYDPGNTLFEGYERVNLQIEMLKNLIRNVHVKNCIIKGGAITQEGWLPSDVIEIDKGVLKWDEIIKNLKKVGYDGFLTLEDMLDYNSLEEKLKYNFTYLKNLVGGRK